MIKYIIYLVSNIKNCLVDDFKYKKNDDYIFHGTLIQNILYNKSEKANKNHFQNLTSNHPV